MDIERWRGRAGPRKQGTDDPIMDEQFSVRFPPELYRRLEAWRAQHPMNPTRVQAVRMAVEVMLERETAVARALRVIDAIETQGKIS